MKAALARASSIAVVMSPAIGDTLLTMVLVNNLVRNGHRPVVFSWVVSDLAEWFPEVEIRHKGACRETFDLVIELHATPFGASLVSTGGRHCELARLEAFRTRRHMIDMFLSVARDGFGLARITRENGIAVPHHVRFRVNERRVAIHPTGSHIEKIWPQRKFVALAKKLVQRGYEPTFLVAPAEREAWQHDHEASRSLRSFDRLADVAAWIAESGWFIGNDSGLGHLASALGVPTLTLFMRRGIARTWQPKWGRGAIVLPRNLVVGVLKERYWTFALSARRVLHSFEQLTRGDPHGSRKNTLATLVDPT